jgi:hypothetical protein
MHSTLCFTVPGDFGATLELLQICAWEWQGMGHQKKDPTTVFNQFLRSIDHLSIGVPYSDSYLAELMICFWIFPLKSLVDPP